MATINVRNALDGFIVDNIHICEAAVSLGHVLLCGCVLCAVYCLGPPPPFANMLGSGWPADCKDNPLGFGCKGTCAMGFTGQPTAVCQGKKGAWATNGACKPAKCDAINLPFVANATWGSCDGLTVGEHMLG
jgi:hypothetical protein